MLSEEDYMLMQKERKQGDSHEENNAIKVTVFMAAYNAAAYIAESIESVLQQTYTNFELLIVDDGSADETVDIILGFQDSRIRLIQNEINKGLPYTRNIALKEAKGEFLAILDSDDTAIPERLAIQIQYFLSRPQLAVLGGSAFVIDDWGMRTGQEMIPICGSDQLHAALLFYNSFVHSTVMLRMSVFREFGGYPNHPVAQDYGLFSRIALKYEVDNIPLHLGEYRKHYNNISIRKQNLIAQQLSSILFYQLDKLLPDTKNIDPQILLTPIEGSHYSIADYYILYREIIVNNNKKRIYPIDCLHSLLYNNWVAIVMEKGRLNTFTMLLSQPIFKLSFATAKQIRKAFKQSFWSLVGRM